MLQVLYDLSHRLQYYPVTRKNIVFILEPFHVNNIKINKTEILRNTSLFFKSEHVNLQLFCFIFQLIRNYYANFKLQFIPAKFQFKWPMVFNATFNNISVISWRSVLLVEETGLPSENNQPAANFITYDCP
jgi:hypothetical protein